MAAPIFYQLTGQTQTIGITAKWSGNITIGYWKYRTTTTAVYTPGGTASFYADWWQVPPFHPFVTRDELIDGGGTRFTRVTWGATDGIVEVVAGSVDLYTDPPPIDLTTATTDEINHYFGDASHWQTVTFSYEATDSGSVPVVGAISSQGQFRWLVTPGATWSSVRTVKIGTDSDSYTCSGSNDTGDYLTYEQVTVDGAGTYTTSPIVKPPGYGYGYEVNAYSTQEGGSDVTSASAYAVYGGHIASGVTVSVSFIQTPAYLSGISNLTATVAGIGTISTGTISCVQPSATSRDRHQIDVQVSLFPKGNLTWNAKIRQLGIASPVGHTIEYRDTFGVRHTSTGVTGSNSYTEAYGGLSMQGTIQDNTGTYKTVYLFDPGRAPDSDPGADLQTTWTRPGVTLAGLTISFDSNDARFDWRWQNTAQGGLRLWQDATKDLAGGEIAFALGTGNDQWRGTNCALSLVSGKLHIETSASGAVAWVTFPKAYLPHRKVKIRWRSIDSVNVNANLILTFDSGTTLTQAIMTGDDGEWIERSFDVLDLDGPLHPFGLFERLRRIDLGSLPNGKKIEVEWIRTERLRESLVQYLDPFAAPHYGADKTEALLDLNTLSALAGHTDGIYSLVTRTLTDTDAVTLTDLVDRITGMAKQSWHAEAVTATPTPYHLNVGADLYPVDGFYSAIAYPRWLYAGGILADNSLYGDQPGNDSSHKAVVPVCPVCRVVDFQSALPLGIGHVNDIGGTQGANITIDFIAVLGAALCGQVISGDGSISIRRVSDHLDGGSGSPGSGGWFQTGQPFARIFEENSSQMYEATADGFEAGYVVGPGYITTVPVELINPDTGFNSLAPRQRLYSRWRLLAKYGRMAIDSARQWLMVATAKKIDTFSLPKVMQLTNPAAEFSSGDTDGVSGWLSMIYHDRGPALWPVAKTDGGATVYVSRDGGKSGGEVLTVEAKSAAIEVDSERRMLILIYENGDNIQRRASEDGGATWSAAADVALDGSAAQGTVLDLVQDGRQVGVLLLLAKVDAGTVVFRSLDRGKTWATVLS